MKEHFGYEKCKGKKLLAVGIEEYEELIEAAHEMGVYVILIGRNADITTAYAKYMADEVWCDDYSNIDKVVEKCRLNGVSGVMAGYSEFKVLFAAKIAAALGTPFYATEEQVNITRNKRSFKDLCLKHGIPVAKDYCFSKPLTEEEKQLVIYPVIVKPTDYAGCKGITVCYNEEQLNEAIEYALQYSDSQSIICEEYVVGTELMAIYTVANGEISLSSLSEKFISQDHERISGLCDIVLAPSRYYEMYVENIDVQIKELLSNIGVKNGVAFFQGIANEQGVKIFEMGYRLNGNNDCRVIEKYNGINYMKMLISYSLTGSMGDDLKKERAHFGRYLCTLCTYLNEGTIGEVDYSALQDKDWVDGIHSYVEVGKSISSDDSTQRRGIFVKLSGTSLDEIAEYIKEAQRSIVVTDVHGNNMLFKPFDTNRLFF
ncbi:MAG: ATP-grasp domain-containing protein [Clostridia bacterium]|nr:ATP-grasp domain-containing protein [Clostridia bacterium]